jgi:hypothetical protein
VEFRCDVVDGTQGIAVGERDMIRSDSDDGPVFLVIVDVSGVVMAFSDGEEAWEWRDAGEEGTREISKAFAEADGEDIGDEEDS